MVANISSPSIIILGKIYILKRTKSFEGPAKVFGPANAKSILPDRDNNK